MSASANDVPTDRLHRGNVSLDDRLESIERKLDKILDASLPMRVRALEIVVYSGCALGLMAIGGALIALVVRS